MTAATVNDAAPFGASDTVSSPIAKAETLLDRAHFSPASGTDGLDGDNFHSAVRAFQESNSLAVTGNLDIDTWSALARNDTAAILKAYAISDADVSGPFTKVIPINLEEMAKLPGLSYTGPLAELAEKFHMAQSLYAGRDTVEVLQPRNDKASIAVTIVVDKPAHNVRAVRPRRSATRVLSSDNGQRGKRRQAASSK